MISSIEEAANNIPLLTVHAGPKDEKWKDRLKEELRAIITYVKSNKQQDNDWFKIEPSKDGIRWQGVCSCTYNLVRYEFKLQFEVPATYPSSPIELELPELEGKTIKMYRGGKICQDIHFAPLWAKHSPKLGIAHALAMALGPWLAA